MDFLITNDDGIGSPFLRRLCEAAKARGHRVTVCAPATQQSTTSHHYHTHDDIRVTPAELPFADRAYAVQGTPVDCVRIALRCLCPEAQAVFSGINLGYNTGWPIYASGTVGAAREAVLTGVPGFAVSAEPATPEDTLLFFADWAVALAERAIPDPLGLCGVWNLNAPCVPLAQVREAVLCPLHRGIYRDAYACTAQPDGTLLFRQQGLPQDPPSPGSDLDLLSRGHLTCTVLSPDAPEAPERCAALLQVPAENIEKDRICEKNVEPPLPS